MPRKTTASTNSTSLPKAPKAKAKGQPRPRPIIKIKPSHLTVDLTNENPNPPVSNPDPSVPNPDPSVSNPAPVSNSSLPQTPDPPVSTQGAPLQPSISANLHPQMASGSLPNPAPAKKLATSTARTAMAQDNTILAAKLATALGNPLLLRGYYITDFQIAEVDRLNKLEAAKGIDLPEVKCPNGPIVDLQSAMGLDGDRALYITCRISL